METVIVFRLDVLENYLDYVLHKYKQCLPLGWNLHWKIYIYLD